MKPPLVVDASVVVKLLLDEEGTDRARTLFDRDATLMAPDFLLLEVANVLWKRTIRREMAAEKAAEGLSHAASLPLALTSTPSLVTAAIELAIALSRTVYDCSYLALALRHDCPMVTADARLVNALADGPLERHIELL